MAYAQFPRPVLEGTPVGCGGLGPRKECDVNLKLGLVIATVLLGGWAGFCATPDNRWSHAASLWGIFDIGCGALGGLFLGGMFVSLRR